MQIAQYGKPIILSTGMATQPEIKQAIRAIYATGNKKLVLLHCTSNYPTKYEDVNLRAMSTLENKFRVPVGYSDHTLGLAIPVAAVALGACVIEKHFTLSKKMAGPDHQASLEPAELKLMVQLIRNTERALGSGAKEPVTSERNVQRAARKSIVAADNLKSGTKIIYEMLAFKRPGTGISPSKYKEVIGKKLKRSIKKNEFLKWEMLA